MAVIALSLSASSKVGRWLRLVVPLAALEVAIVVIVFVLAFASHLSCLFDILEVIEVVSLILILEIELKVLSLILWALQLLGIHSYLEHAVHVLAVDCRVLLIVVTFIWVQVEMREVLRALFKLIEGRTRQVVTRHLKRVQRMHGWICLTQLIRILSVLLQDSLALERLVNLRGISLWLILIFSWDTLTAILEILVTILLLIFVLPFVIECIDCFSCYMGMKIGIECTISLKLWGVLFDSWQSQILLRILNVWRTLRS